MNASHLEKRESDAYSRVLPLADASGSVSVAGARSGLQNRGCEAASPIFHKKLRNQAPSLTAQGQRAESNDPDLAAVIDAWDRLPEGVRQSVVMLVKAAAGQGE
jgi:hypothetical protein